MSHIKFVTGELGYLYLILTLLPHEGVCLCERPAVYLSEINITN